MAKYLARGVGVKKHFSVVFWNDDKTGHRQDCAGGDFGFKNREDNSGGLGDLEGVNFKLFLPGNFFLSGWFHGNNIFLRQKIFN